MWPSLFSRRTVPTPAQAGARGGAGTVGVPARVLALVLALLPFATSACYTYAPLRTAPSPGTVVVLDINDQGRVALGQRLGTELARIEGELVRWTDGEYVIRMRQVQTLGGTTTHWSGETVELRDAYVKNVGERQLSRSRSLFAAAGFAVAVGLVVAGQSLLGLGAGDSRDGGGPTGEH